MVKVWQRTVKTFYLMQAYVTKSRCVLSTMCMYTYRGVHFMTLWPFPLQCLTELLGIYVVSPFVLSSPFYSRY